MGLRGRRGMQGMLLALALLAPACGGGGAARRPPVEIEDQSGDGDEEVTVDDTVGDDMQSETDVRAIFERKQNQVARCYTKRLAAKPDLAKGEFEVKGTIANEKASNLEVRGVTWRDSEIEACVVKLVKDWSFPDVRGPEPFTYYYRFDKW